MTDDTAAQIVAGIIGSAADAAQADRDDWPVHQPEVFDAPIPGRVWASGCEPGGDWDSELGRYTGVGPRVNPETGRCESCGETACCECGRENCPAHGRAPEADRPRSAT